MKADADQVQALADAKMKADADQVQALADAKMKADADQVQALADAKMKADADQVQALADAKMKADAALKVVQEDLDKFKRENADIVAAAAAKEASDMAKAVLTAIGKNIGPEVAPMVSLAASSAGNVTAEQIGYTMSAAPEEISGWRGRTLGNDGDTTVIYTNIANAKATEIGDIYDSTSAPGEPDVYSVFTMVDEDNNTYDIPWSAAKRADDKSGTTGAGNTAKTTFAGSVGGLAGTFSCTGGTCNPPVPDPTTGVIDSGELWTFVPRVAGGTIDVEDDAYVSFGWWLNAMGTDGAYEFDAFASATGMGIAVDNLGFADVSGTATYRGAAAGKYAILSTSDDSASGGHFTAAAKLTANFDASNAGEGQPVDDGGVSIGGTITDFMTGETSRPNWKVTLTTPVTTSVGPIGTDAKTTWSTGGAVDGEGTWSANFYGAEEDTMHPTAAIGEFNAAIGGGAIARISGAFAATKQ